MTTLRTVAASAGALDGAARPADARALASAAPDVAVLASADAIERARPAWEAFRPGPAADLDAFLSVVRTRPTARGPYVLAHPRDDGAAALLVARVEDADYRCRFGYQTVFHRRVRALAVEYGGALRRDASVSWLPLVRGMRDALRDGVADVAHVRRVDVGSEFLSVLRAEVPRWCRNESEAPEAHWCLDLPDTEEELLLRVSGRTRQTLRRARRVLERAFPGAVAVRRTTAPQDVPAFCRRAEQVARATYQRGLDAGFVHDAEYEARLVLAAERGRLRAYELEVDGVPRAFWIAELRDGTHTLDATGHAPDFGRWSPGKVLRLEVLRDAIAEGARRVDYGFGDAEYKRQFGARCWWERDVWVFAPGLRGAWLNGTRGGVAWASRAARAVVESARVGAPLRRLTRRAAERRVAEEEPPAR